MEGGRSVGTTRREQPAANEIPEVGTKRFRCDADQFRQLRLRNRLAHLVEVGKVEEERLRPQRQSFVPQNGVGKQDCAAAL